MCFEANAVPRILNPVLKNIANEYSTLIANSVPEKLLDQLMKDLAVVKLNCQLEQKPSFADDNMLEQMSKEALAKLRRCAEQAEAKNKKDKSLPAVVWILEKVPKEPVAVKVEGQKKEDDKTKSSGEVVKQEADDDAQPLVEDALFFSLIFLKYCCYHYFGAFAAAGLS